MSRVVAMHFVLQMS